MGSVSGGLASSSTVPAGRFVSCSCFPGPSFLSCSALLMMPSRPSLPAAFLVGLPGGQVPNGRCRRDRSGAGRSIKPEEVHSSFASNSPYRGGDVVMDVSENVTARRPLCGVCSAQGLRRLSVQQSCGKAQVASQRVESVIALCRRPTQDRRGVHSGHTCRGRGVEIAGQVQHLTAMRGEAEIAA